VTDLHPGRRFVLVLEYRLPEAASVDAAAEIGRVARDRLVDAPLEHGAAFVGAWAAKGRVAFEIIEMMPPRN
jgi:hypothetical protein